MCVCVCGERERERVRVVFVFFDVFVTVNDDNNIAVNTIKTYDFGE